MLDVSQSQLFSYVRNIFFRFIACKGLGGVDSQEQNQSLIQVSRIVFRLDTPHRKSPIPTTKRTLYSHIPCLSVCLSNTTQYCISILYCKGLYYRCIHSRK